jgi:hypothetical protein
VVVGSETHSVLELPPASRARTTIWCAVLAILVLGGLGWFVIRPLVLTGSGDPGGKVMAQLVPTASALPGYATSKLPWTSDPVVYSSYVTKMEPHQDSCDGIAGTQGWSQVVLQAGFAWSGASSALISQVDARMSALGWSQSATGLATEARWTKPLDNGTLASASLDLDPTGPPWWEFVATAPPVGKAAGGC